MKLPPAIQKKVERQLLMLTENMDFSLERQGMKESEAFLTQEIKAIRNRFGMTQVQFSSMSCLFKDRGVITIMHIS